MPSSEESASRSRLAEEALAYFLSSADGRGVVEALWGEVWGTVSVRTEQISMSWSQQRNSNVTCQVRSRVWACLRLLDVRPGHFELLPVGLSSSSFLSLFGCLEIKEIHAYRLFLCSISLRPILTKLWHFT